MKRLLPAAGLLFLISAGCDRAAEGPPRPSVMSGGLQSGCTSRAYPEIGGPFALVDHTGRPVTEADFTGQPALLYFGFTYCPDVCPAALSTIGAAFRMLPEDMARPQALLVSVDPERDTPEALARYVTSSSFPPGLVGLTGTPDQIRAAADVFMADYARIEQPDSLAEYTMDHTNLIYVMDASWRLATFFTHEDTPATISACLAELF